jgi:hypothetical protein
MATPTNLPAVEVDGTSLPAAWLNDLRGAFRIMQVVQGSTTTLVGSSTTTYGDTGLSATITPQSASSLILVLYTQNGYANFSTTGLNLRLLRGATVLETFVDLQFGTSSGTVANNGFQFLDTPATTSAITYKTQMARNSGAGIVYTQVNNNPARMTLFEVSA